MSNALSVDLRKRAVAAYERGEGTLVEVAKRFEIGERTLRSWLKQQQETGTLEPLPHTGGKSKQKLFEEHDQALMAWLEEKPDLTRQELVELLQEHFGLQLHVSNITRALQRLGWTRKKSH